MTPDEIIGELMRSRSRVPHEALREASLHRDELATKFMGVLLEVIFCPKILQEDNDLELPFYAMYLLAAWREKRAHPLILGFLRLPGDLPVDLSGDIVTEDMDRILAQTCGGDPSGIISLASDDHVNEWARGAAIGALSLLVRWGEVPREFVIEQYRRWLLAAEPPQDPEAFDMPTEVASGAMDLQAVELREEILLLFDRGWIDESMVGGREEVIDELEHAFIYSPQNPIDDVADAIRWWGCFKDKSGDAMPHARNNADPMEQARLPGIDSSIPYRAPPKIGRNDACPCGSGKKYKKCCGF